MDRSPCSSKQGLNRGARMKTEDIILSDYILNHGDGGWRLLPQKAGTKCGKSCRLRWTNYLRPNIKRGNISPDEEDLIVRQHRLLGNRWSLIAGRLAGRTDNEIKNYLNSRLSKKLLPTNEQNLKKSSRSPSALQDHVVKTITVKTTAVRYSEMVRPNRCNGYGRSKSSSNEAFKLCNSKETANSSLSCSELLVNDSITHDCSKRTALAKADGSPLETEAGNSICSMWNLADQRSLDSHYFGGDSATLSECLSNLNDLSSPDCSLFSSPSDCLTYFGLGEFNRESALAEETSVF